MISQKCPKCHSTRVRRGYRPTPIWSKVLFRYNLLCDNCNWEFRGFAVPGTVTAKPTKKPKKNLQVKKNDSFSDFVSKETEVNLETESPENMVPLDNLGVKSSPAGKKGQS